MFSFFKRFFSSKPDIAQLLNDGAMVIDVRTQSEYQRGHGKNTRNIPLNSIKGKLTSLKKQKKVIITCCASGMRSGKAAKMLRNAGLDAHNGGPWQSVERHR
jgi:rhodanese-related sulfurtransferase